MRLVIGRGTKRLGLLRRDGRVPLDEARGDAPEGLDPEGEGGHVEEEEIRLRLELTDMVVDDLLRDTVAEVNRVVAAKEARWAAAHPGGEPSPMSVRSAAAAQEAEQQQQQQAARGDEGKK